MPKITWEAFQAFDLVGRDLVNDDDLCGGFARGPITAITINDGIVSIVQSWVARASNPLAPTVEQRWRWLKSPSGIGVNTKYVPPPVVDDDGRITFAVPYCGTVTILPAGDHLDPKRVEGLPEQVAT